MKVLGASTSRVAGCVALLRVQRHPLSARRLLRSAWGTRAWWFLPLLISLFSWEPLPVTPSSGLDESWVASLYMGAHDGLVFGTQEIFTYGPLGFLTQPTVWHLHLAELAFFYAVLTRWAVAAAVFNALRISYGLAFGVVGALVVCSVAVGMHQMGELVLGLACAVWAMRVDRSDRAVLWATVGLGAFAGFELLVKLSLGASVLVMSLVLAVGGPRGRRRGCAAALGGFLMSLLVFWVIAGQPVAALPTYLWTGVQIVIGYTPAMSIGDPSLAWEGLAALVGLVVGCWAAWTCSRDRPPPVKWVHVVIWCVFWFASFKEGFVRHDAGHGLTFFLALMLGFVVLTQKRAERAFGVTSIGFLVVLALASQSQPLTGDLHPLSDMKAFGTDAADYTNLTTAAKIAGTARGAIRAALPLDQQTLSELSGHTVAIYPDEQSLAWAYNLRWDPIPVIQSYSAYTPVLDGVDARFIRSNRPPQRILFNGTPGIDGRIGAFDEGLTLRAIFCRYRLISAAAGYSVLARGSDRCTSPAREIKTVRAAWGQAVTVPTPPGGRYMVYVRIAGTATSGLARLWAALYKPQQRFVVINGGSPARLVTGTADDGLPLKLSPGVDYKPPFNVAVGASSIAVVVGNGGQPSGRPIRYSFFLQKIGRP